MNEITFNEFRKLLPLLDHDSLTTIHEFSSRWFEGDIKFTMSDEDYARVLRHFGLTPVDKHGNEYNLDTRPSWDEYFLGIADAVAARGDCSRRQVGAVVVDKDNRIVSTGFNGSYPGGPSCLAGECPRADSDAPPFSSYDTGPGACIASHAEANALLYAGRNGTKGSVLYITCQPCDGCLKLIKASGVKKVVWPTGCISKKDLYG